MLSILAHPVLESENNNELLAIIHSITSPVAPVAPLSPSVPCGPTSPLGPGGPGSPGSPFIPLKSGVVHRYMLKHSLPLGELGICL